MTKTWEQIEKFYTDLQSNNPTSVSMLKLVKQIRESSYAEGIHAWTSCLELNITQSETTYPCEDQYLCIKPVDHEMVEFRFVDTPIKKKQWNRTVPADEAFDRLKRFFNELHWFNK